jgi:hypothetical protein
MLRIFDRFSATTWSLVVLLVICSSYMFRVWAATDEITVPVSPSVNATVVRSDEGLALLVLWRGSPGWRSRTTGRRSQSVSGRAGVYSVAFDYGSTAYSLTYDAAAHTATLQGKSMTVPAGTNVLLVDDVDTNAGPKVAGALILDSGNANLDPRYGSLGPLFGRSNEIVAFLRCGVGETTAAIDSMACAHIGKIGI